MTHKQTLLFIRGVVVTLKEWLGEYGIDAHELEAIERRIDYLLERKSNWPQQGGKLDDPMC